ncbi:SDR family NAD(P)-dependent oxidoreductase [Geotalea uraniireducens]|uniref:Beta-ketoacyl synthase n=1 Tax=Geotalea uraniireducens (strain Rf4) TaxID=351605 RepID=A5G642_GEOUR|nr:SDR family NAD(P)-dependent oxidoreductase [Geotalea uraniireducens]ABQ27260.1 beta-ketoacyl synthase [Geotalea uraniireducens Rf4]
MLKFRSCLKGNESFLKDHKINGKKILPGVAYLEMARAAVESALNLDKSQMQEIVLKNVAWLLPVVVEDNPVNLFVGVAANDNGEIDFEVCSTNVDGETVAHSYGSAEVTKAGETERIAISTMLEQRWLREVSSEEYYEAFGKMGIEYGPGHRGIERVYARDGEVLAKLSMPDCVKSESDHYVLHPSMLDSALQAAMGLIDGLGEVAVVPYAMERVEIKGKWHESMWAFARYGKGKKAAGRLESIDIDLCDHEGNVCVRMKGLAAREMSGEKDKDNRVILFHPEWKEEKASTAIPMEAYAEKIVVLYEPGPATEKEIVASLEGSRVITLRPGKDGVPIDERYENYTVGILEEIQGIVKRKPGRVLIQAVVFATGEGRLFAGHAALFKTARQEHPDIDWQMIELEDIEDAERVTKILKDNARSEAGKSIKYKAGNRSIAEMRELASAREIPRLPWKEKGVYLISGGVGGLGLIFARDIVENLKECTIILAGRSELTPDKESIIQGLKANGSIVKYYQADVTDNDQIESLIKEVVGKYGRVHGIIHSAGVIRDSYIVKKNRKDVEQVLRPKIKGLMAIEEAISGMELDVLLLFSSLAGVLGNAGQSDYAAANGFMDAYAQYRNELAEVGQRRGKALSLNWPLWKEGGMQVNPDAEKMMLQSWGMIPLQTSTGIRALYQGLASEKGQVLVMEGRLGRIRQKLDSLMTPAGAQPKTVPVASGTLSEIDSSSLQEKVLSILMQAVSELLRVKLADIDADVELNDYGFDSVSLTQFANTLNREYKLELAPTVFFEYPTLSRFAKYLVEAHSSAFSSSLGAQTNVQTKVQTKAAARAEEDRAEETTPGTRRHPRFAVTAAPAVAKPSASSFEPVAIVGLSGRFPFASDVDEFWKNLMDGRDCITEIPNSRWDWRRYYGDPAKEANKTNAKCGGFIDGVDEFDPLFFGISPREAEIMDPNQRLLMTHVWKAIEDAGYSAQSLSGTNTAIFAGTATSGYSELLSRAKVAIEAYSATGVAASVGPNRMSYFLNIHGPSEPIETACSSSLVAIHRAVAVLQDGTCEMAIAGGVNTIVSPELHLSFSKAGMLCEDGRCKTFSNRANGYARGEGVGVLFLKKLKDAERDNDHVHAVIRGTAENHGGRANSLTAPNPVAQADLLTSAYTTAGIDPRTVGYIEAHGTGTELGDPIEINGLKAAFKELYRATGEPEVTSAHCGLGSVKTNIGHLELAAGIAGVIKVIQQLKYKTLAKSLHCDVVNPYIQLENSPFYIVQENREWKALRDGNGNELPRRAGVSSFGFGGANAHVVIEEYVPKDQPHVAIAPPNPAIIVLSAKNEERLKEQAQLLVAAIRERQFSDADLVNIAYTLQVGRDAMEERLALIPQSVQELSEALTKYCEGREGIEKLYRGQVKPNKEALSVFSMDEELQEAIEKWMERGKYSRLLGLWVRGQQFDWNKLYRDPKPRRVSLPTYPFTKERYWVPETREQKPEYQEQRIHPLLHQNASDFSEQRFSSTFTGEEFFLTDHVVRGRKVLPGVAYLEMARAALEQAAGAEEPKAGIRLKNVVWARPIAVDAQPVRVHIGLVPNDTGEITYEIYSDSQANGAEPLVHGQGAAEFLSTRETSTLDIEALQAECTQESLSSSQCYEAFLQMGFEYGPGHRGIVEAYVGVGQVLAKLSLPDSVSQTDGQYVLHPSLMDSALQASIGLIRGQDQGGALKPVVPFALQELDVLGTCTPSMWTLIRYGKGSKPGDSVQQLDIDVSDEHGKVRVTMRGLSLKGLDGEVRPGASTAIGTVMLEPVWNEQSVAEEATAADQAEHLVLLCGQDDLTHEEVTRLMSGARCISFHSEQKGIGERFGDYALQAFQEIQSVLRSKSKGKLLVQVVFSGQGDGQLFGGLSGLLKTARLENPNFGWQLIEVETRETSESIVEKLKGNSRSALDQQIRYQGGKRFVCGWREVASFQEQASIPWRDRGVYLITGGAGNLGLIFAKEIANRVTGATLILTGRSPLSEVKRAQLRELEASGARVEYQQVDVSQKDAVAGLIQALVEEFGSINGIIHAAGVTRDSFIIKKTNEEFLEVLGPKVGGLVHLDQASQHLELDLVLLFSSAAAAAGNLGQADYAAANAFMDAYAAYRNDLVARNERRGRTFSINWPLWQEGGMQVDAETRQMMLQTRGMIPLPTATGIAALYQALACGKNQIMVIDGDPQRVTAGIIAQPSRAELRKDVSPVVENGVAPEVTQDSLRDKASDYFKKLVAAGIKLPAHRVDVDAPMERYGIDSIMVLQLTNELEKVFGSLPKTLFFEYQTIQALSGYFLESHRDQLMGLLEIEQTPTAAADTSQNSVAAPKPAQPVASNRRPSRFASRAAAREEKANEVSDIAIIGVSGRYPGAGNLGEFWKNLRDGKDCITEIPKDRWDHSLYFDADKNKQGKTNSKWGGFLDGVDLFDTLFFNISPREAEIMDPQERLFLQCVYETLENAGYTREALGLHQGGGLEGNVGVYVGVMYEEYQLYGAQETAKGRPLALAGNPSSIANRVSYFCNFHGPSMAVDTMCSSSLTAIHLACQSLQRGGCEVAIAGGVNVSVHPNKYMFLGQGKFVSSKGRCESFGEGGDGYVPGEGVGAVLLKPLAKAVADGDQIYGVIKASTINHGGKTNGYTVPNPNAQASVIGRALQQSGVHPRTISYIEAHGTGTSLGDPIEIAGLAKTFQEHTKEKQFCSIGSAKSNIGHCESAAGIAGVTKVLLQLKHRQLAPSLHSEVLNPNIDFSTTPFVVQQQLAEWKRPVVEINGQTREYPRIAGISSFGAGGSNAHVVIEEYIPEGGERIPVRVSAQHPAIVVLSAKNEKRLEEQARRLLGAIQERQFSDADLADAAYTLQVGREAMDARLAMVVASIKDLEEKLSGYLDGKSDLEHLHKGHVKRDRDNDSAWLYAVDEDMAKTIDAWVSKGKYARLLDLWVKGLNFDWNRLYGAAKPHRISLPTYPFAGDRYWVPEIAQTAGASALLPVAHSIHPLLHQNTSDLTEQRFSSIFTGEEFFLADHAVSGEKILPVAAYLEMARAAVDRAAGSWNPSQKGISLKNIVWARPITVTGQPVQVHVGLFPKDNGEIGYEIYSESTEHSAETIINSQGSALFGPVADIPVINLLDVQSECDRELSSAQCYDAFKTMGSEYGARHRGIERAYAGSTTVLAKLSLPSSISETEDHYLLHPSMLDSAMQASLLIVGEPASMAAPKPMVPSTLHQLEILQRCTSLMWAVIRSGNSGEAAGRANNVDVDLCDENGSVCVRMRGLSFRVLEGGQGTVGAAADQETLVLKPVWEAPADVKEGRAPEYAGHLVILCQMSNVLKEGVEVQMDGVRSLIISSEEREMEKRFPVYAQQVFEQIQSLLNEKPKGKVLVQMVIPNNGEGNLLAALNGVLKTAHQENPKLTGQLIAVDSTEDADKTVEKLKYNSRCPADDRVRYEEGKRQVVRWKEIGVSQASVGMQWKEQGVYLITGGAGGLGFIFAKELARKANGITLILTGRSAHGDAKQALLQELESLGARAQYRQTDVTERNSVEQLVKSIVDDHGNLNGIIHSAGVNKDNFIIKKTVEEFHEVLSPKVAGLVNLDYASKDLGLDFFVLFSSVAGAFGSPGQADYSTANAFMDCYAAQRNALVQKGERFGATLSINWPLWREGGMQVDAETEKMMQHKLGLRPLPSLAGIQAFHTGLVAGFDQTLVLHGNRARIQEQLLDTISELPSSPGDELILQADSLVLKEKVVYQLKVLLGRVVKLSAHRIDAHEPLESYGIDSIMITQLNQELAKIFGELSKTLFYEYQDLDALAAYFITGYPQRCLQWTGLRDSIPTGQKASAEDLHQDGDFPVLTSFKIAKTSRRSFSGTQENHGNREPIAIIGMSGRYPQADNLGDYWENLKAGRDCITEIPEDRWPLDGFYHADPQEAVEMRKSYSKWGGFVRGFADFDPLFFNISALDAINTDPQERLFIQSCWEVFEDAGYTREQLAAQFKGRVGVFAGITKNGFALYGPDLWRQGETISPRTSFSSVANRVSYLFNLRGPSMAVDTMCSASLTAIHEACEHLHHKECEMAIAGGVNLYLHPASYVELCALQMLSTDGQCKSFGLDGNGFVPGEGVGVVLLKPLSRAIADRDQIHAVIRGSRTNHGGKTNGYTVPSPVAQGELIRETLDKAGIHARAVSYIEAHGTGTKLGDPIEITGLAQAFHKDTADTGYCAIGSVKSNIGHLEAAAGIAGVTKIVLQMKHRSHVPSLHSVNLNPNIDFAKTPFTVQQELSEWVRPVVEIDGETREYPRIAGISSFGAGGSNAHVILEEYAPGDEERTRVAINAQHPALIVLSARDGERLRASVERLLGAQSSQRFTDADLADVAYTLQIGREAMEERMALIVATVSELEQKLKDYLNGKDDIEGLSMGQVKRDNDMLAVFTADDDMQEAIGKWIRKRKYSKVLDLWVQGIPVDWNVLYGDSTPRRISLPAYPFAGERYWLPEIKGQRLDAAGQGAPGSGNALHPLLHQNTSDLTEQRFSSTFTGQEFFLSDHVVRGERVFPGVAYLEMARAAVDRAAGGLKQALTGISLKHVVWARPIIVNDRPVQVHIGLFPEDNGEIGYEVYSESPEAGTVVHSQGQAKLLPSSGKSTLDISALRAACNLGTLTPAQCYGGFRAMGIEYGSGHRGIEHIFVGANQALAKLSLPSSVCQTVDQFVLHPSIMDSAFQACAGLMDSFGSQAASGSAPSKPILPFALQELEILGRCSSSMWALIRYGNGSKPGDAVQKIDITVCDEHGNVQVVIKGLSLRSLEGEVPSVGASASIGTLMLEPVWNEQALAEIATAPDLATHLVLLCGLENGIPEAVTSQMSGTRCVALQSEQKGIEERFTDHAARLFAELQGILREKHRGSVLVQVVLPADPEGLLFTGLLGLLKSARMENPRLIGQLIEVEARETSESIVEKLNQNSHDPLATHIRYRDGKRFVAGLSELEVPGAEENIPWKEGGVYLITGGAGGLGMIFAGEIAHKVRSVTLVLTGRSSLNDERRSRLKELEGAGARIVYKEVDVTRREAVAELIQNIMKEFGTLTGIIHAAGVVRDNFIIKKTQEELLEVLAPKVMGLVNLDQETKHLNQDLFILFSSGAGLLGNIGQADYAAANAFMDAYAAYRNGLVARNERLGRTFSINWPLWQEGGMRIDAKTESMSLQRTGMISLQTQTGIRALYQCLACGRDQVMPLEGDVERLRAVLLDRQDATETSTLSCAAEEGKTVPAVAQDLLQEKATDYLKKLISSVIKYPASKIDANAPMEKYGIDSIMVMQLTNQLEKAFGSLPKTLFFEYQTIQALSGYFLESHRDQLMGLLEIEQKPTTAADSSQNSVAAPKSVQTAALNRRQARFACRAESQEEKANEESDIAIIGVSGRYPGAENIGEFWKNLRDGKDCITEIPKERWDHSLYFDADKNKKGKTYSKWGGFLDGVDRFDTLFFNITPREAEILDPQERLFLQCVYETLENAGYTREVLGTGLDGNVGVYVGVMYEEYQLYGAQETALGRPLALSGSPSSIANRVSYFCNFHGPSMAVDTMCSSSLTAIHLACQSLQRGGCEVAIAGGVNVSVHPNKYMFLGQGKFVSSKGRCESFGEGGDGYVPGEGVGAVLLKPLAKAVADGDQIYGVIKASTINHGGKTNGYTVPNPNAQASVIGRALQQSGVHPRTISYIEAHGTGTSLGDPIEIAGLAKTFQEHTKEKQFCSIGSAKSNIGHCESAAGIAGVTKVLLQLKHRQLAPSLHSEVLNPNIDFSTTPFVVQQQLAEWKRPVVEINGQTREYPRIAGISSFGAGGSNAHVVIEEYIPEGGERIPVRVSAQHPAIVVLSAKNEKRLEEQARRLLGAIQERQFSDADLADAAYTLQVGREAMDARLALVVASIKELEEKLSGFLDGTNDIEDLYKGNVKRDNDSAWLYAVDEDMAKTIDAWVSKGKYARLLELWVKGMHFDWNRLYGAAKPRRIGLPTYPFAGERYWVPEMAQSSVAGVAPAVVSDSQRERVILIKDWQQKNAGAASDIPSGLIIVLGTAATAELAAELFSQRTDIRAIHVVHDALSSSDAIPTDFYSASAGEDLYHQIRERRLNRKLLGVIDLTAYDSEYERSVAVESGKIAFLQKLIEYDRSERFTLLQVTHALHAFHLATTTLQGARLAGLYRMLGSEYKQILSLTMDSDCPLAMKEKLAAQIKNEFANTCQEHVSESCYRNDRRYEPQLRIGQTDVDIEKNYPETERYRSVDVILITGGSRGIGASIAEHLVSQGCRNLAILGREALPEQSEWKTVLERNDMPEMSEKLRRMQSFVEQGVRVRYYTTPLTDQDGLRDMVDDIHRHAGPLTGIFHCAGVTGKKPVFFNKTYSEIESVCEPKMTGLATLHKVVETEPLAFFILFSSISSVAPTLSTSQSDYAMANAYMDYFAEYQASHGHAYVKSIQWPAWGETGMAANGQQTPAYKKTGLALVSTANGLMLLDVIKNGSYRVSLPCVVIPHEFRHDQLLKTTLKVDLQPARAVSAAPQLPPAHRLTAGVKESVRQWLRNTFMTELKLTADQLDEDTSFDDYGIDSIMFAQLVQTLEKGVQGKLDPALLFEHTTLAALTDYFSAHHADQFQADLAASTPAEAALSEDSTAQMKEPAFEGLGGNEPIARNEIVTAPEDIAVVGISCRFPDSPTKEAYWELLAKGEKAIREVPENRWESNGRRDYGGWIDDIDMFDPEFFKLKENDAMIMDPQARVVLEEGLKAIYDAGYESKDVSGQRVGVYLGGRAQITQDIEKVLEATNPILGLGQNYLATNISRFLNITGPSLVVDTACSSGLTAISMASDTLKNGRIDMAMAGAVNLILNPFTHRLFEARKILSKNGDFKIFEKQAGGEVLGEGAGVVVLKRLSDAVRDGNKIYGVIKAIAVNNDGRTLGPGSPNMETQKQVMKEALELSGKTPEDIGYIEVNGGGSPVVDSIEIRALSEIYRLDDKKMKSCVVGSIKPNIGHLLLTSGLAGFIRCMLSLEEKKIPPFLSALEPFEHYDFTASRIAFNRECSDWLIESGRKRIAAQNSFPDGGTNCHVIMEEFVPEVNYTQRLFSLAAPAMNKRSFASSRTVTFQQDSLVKSTNEDSIDDFIDRFKSIDNQMINLEAVQSSVKNVWGEFDEKNI